MFNPVHPEVATGEALAALNEAKSQFGNAINLCKVTANAPNTLKGILAYNKELSNDMELTKGEIELVAMLTSALNHCDYCVNVHMQVGKMYGLTENDLIDAMSARAQSARDQSLLNYTNELVRNRGRVSQQTLIAIREQGFSEKALLEVVGVVGIYTSLNYIRHIANPEHDFPKVTQFDASVHGA
ncbi:carboxymuconolactone decarboxylase family protein [Aurantivibrio plasticivorans]